MVSIFDTSFDEELLGYAASVLNAASQQLDLPTEATSEIAFVDAYVVGRWATGEAEFGEDPIQVVIELDTGDLPPGVITELSDRLEEEKDGDVVPRPPILDQAARDIFFATFGRGNLEGFLSAASQSENISSATAVRLSDLRLLELNDRGEVRPASRGEPSEEELEERRPVFDPSADVPELVSTLESIEETLAEGEEADTGPTREDLLVEMGVPRRLTQFAVSPNRLEIKAGKETKSVEPRELYDWELEMGLSSVELQELNRERDLDQPTLLQNPRSVGFAEEQELFSGSPDETSEAVANYPNTVEYIRQHLLNEGPSYQLEIFNNLVIYGGFISSRYDKDYSASSYQNIRNIFGRLKLIEERGIGPQLVRKLDPVEAAAEGLDTTPIIERGDTEIEAPWLEDKVYFEIVESNSDSDLWRELNSALYAD